MAWSVSLVLDDDKSDVGHAVAVWNAGQPDEFQYAGRIQLSGTGPKDFKNAAVSARNKRSLKQSSALDFESVLLGVMNG